MKKLYMLAVLLLVAVGASAQEGRNIYNKYSGNNEDPRNYKSSRYDQNAGNYKDT